MYIMYGLIEARCFRRGEHSRTPVKAQLLLNCSRRWRGPSSSGWKPVKEYTVCGRTKNRVTSSEASYGGSLEAGVPPGRRELRAAIAIVIFN